MRFKRLRVFVGVALLLFVLIAGNIIAFGIIQKNRFNDDNGSDDNNKIYSDGSLNAAIFYTDRSPPAIMPQPTQQQVPTQPAAPSQPTTIKHTRIVTAAS